MKKLVIALTALAAFTGSASAADLGARPYAKAPAPVLAAPSWTGFYIFGGGGGGLWSANGGVDATATGVCIVCTNTRTGGDGWFGTVGAGYDWQTGPSWVFGIFGDGTFGSLKGNIGDAGVFAGGAALASSAPQRWRQLGQPVLALATSSLRTFCPTSTAVTPGPTGRAAPCWAPSPAPRRACTPTASTPRAGSSAAASRTT